MGDFCHDHGVKWFEQCPTCGGPWPTRASGRYAVTSVSLQSKRQTASDFCGWCGMPGPWLTRKQLIEWLKSNIKGSPEIPTTERLELLEVLSKLEAMGANDTRTATSWKRVRDAAPMLWEKAKPVRDAVIGEAVKKVLEAGFG